ncbi:hypothetical protein J4E85_004692 [Alternaria conjuncta]|uniref:uncharacterized protein n=1 Tax=Alternaria conjuncta TaxID=181017 RepID=UPI00221E6981|nr:uncharacterized protein J4E85_004692 [Alternaria conjuncta]KAI4930068.1 hypothetical protein J4E85_004692 [Alternaria conjuncta]
MYKVRAVFDYVSNHEDDLGFKVGQIISVTEEEGDDWYVGEYTDDSGTKHDGLFPRNFVERYEPEPPPRPNRASRHKPLEQPPAQEAPPTPQIPQQEPEPVLPQEPEPPKPQAPPIEVPSAAKTTPLPMSPMSPRSASSAKAPEALPPQSESSKPAPPAKKAPPPVAPKNNAFRDRIAAFNKPTDPPPKPFKPSGGAPSFIKKPFVAPPPSRNAYVPPTREAPPVKTYRREEDPEIAERQAQTQNDAERAGLVAHDKANANEGEEEPQPKISLKERIALLQKQQQEQAERAAAMHKEKPKRPPVAKRTESQDAPAEDSEDTGLERVTSGASKGRASMDQNRPPRTSHDIRSPDALNRDRDLLSENDADQSAAGDTEDAGGESTSVEEDQDRPKSRHPPPPPPRAPTAPTEELNVGDEQDVPEEEEEEEEDEETAELRRKEELRERMRRLGGGIPGMPGMPGMFGGGMPMGGGLPPKKKKSTTEKRPEETEEYSMPQQRVPMFGMPGMMPVRSPEPEDRTLSVEKEDETSHPVTGTHSANEVPDVEEVASQPARPTTGDGPPPVPTDRRLQSPSSETLSKTYVTYDGLSEYVMTDVLLPLLSHQPVLSPGPGSESGDEMTDTAPTPSAPSQPSNRRASYFASGEPAQDLAERRVPPIPSAGPTSPTMSRPPPPPPPTQAPPSRHEDLPIRKLDRNEGETDYEGDYDTDMAPEATHKDALKSHARDSSVEDNTLTDEPTSARSPTIPQGMPPLPPTAPRAVPPPPPQQGPSRPSTDAPRGAPPLPPVPPPTRSAPMDDDDEEYDPFKYTGPPLPQAAAPPAPRAVPPPPQSQPPPPQNRPPPPMPPSMPPVPHRQAGESDEEDDLYSSPPARKSHDRPPPPPPQAPPHQHAPPPLPPLQAPPPPAQERMVPPPPQERPVSMFSPVATEAPPRMLNTRKSLDAAQMLTTRSSMDQPRPATNQGFIANDIDLGMSSHWWTQPKLLPPSLQARKDVLVDMKESQSGNTVEKLIKVLYLDYSQTIISARFESTNVSDVDLEQRNEPPPPSQRPDQLENAYEQFGRTIAKTIESKQNTVVGNGTPQGLIEELFKPFNDALPPISTRSYGALVYANLANASTQVYDEIRPGDIISFRNAKFQGKTGPMHAKYAMDVGKPDHVGVVVEWDGSKKKVRAWEQGREHKKVKPESFKMGDLRSGEVRVWRVMSKSWVGWN